MPCVHKLSTIIEFVNTARPGDYVVFGNSERRGGPRTWTFTCNEQGTWDGFNHEANLNTDAGSRPDRVIRWFRETEVYRNTAVLFRANDVLDRELERLLEGE